MVKQISNELQQYVLDGGFLDCKDIHDDGCLVFAIKRFFKSMLTVYKEYLGLYLIRLLIFNNKKLKQNPKKALYDTLRSFLRSLCFMGLFVSSLVYSFCLFKNYRQKIDSYNAVMACLVSSLSTFIESESRAKEINFYMFPRCIETIIQLLQRRGYNFDIKYINEIMYGFIIGLTHYIHKNNEDAFSQSYNKFLNQFLF